MGRSPCCSKVGLHKGAWSTQEDALLTNYIQANGEGKWRSLPQKAGLLRCGKSCRLRWMNYLRPGVKRGNITAEEEDLIIRQQSLLGNRWSLIAGRLPGRTDNEIKNHWNTHILRKLKKEGLTTKPQKSHKKNDFKRSKKQPKNVNPPNQDHHYDQVSPMIDQMYAPDSDSEPLIKLCSFSGFTTSNCTPVESLVSGSCITTSTSNDDNNQEEVDKEEANNHDYENKKREGSEISWSSLIDNQLDEQSLYQGSILDQYNLVCNNYKDPILIDDDCDLSIQGGGEEEVLLNDNLVEQFYHEYLQLL